MITIFDYLNTVLYKKYPPDSDESYSQYMINRWCSMHSPEVAEIINRYNNQYIITQKPDQLKFLSELMPKVRFKKLNYIKKAKKEKEVSGNNAQRAMFLELSTREVAQNDKYLSEIQKLN